MELMGAPHGRRATRASTQEPVTRSVSEGLIDSAIHAPSAVNEQPWDFTVIQNMPLLGWISASAKASMFKVIESGSFPIREDSHEITRFNGLDIRQTLIKIG